MRITEEYSLTLRQADQARSDFYAIGDDLEFVKAQLARLPTRGEMAKTALGIIFATMMLMTLSILAFLSRRATRRNR